MVTHPSTQLPITKRGQSQEVWLVGKWGKGAWLPRQLPEVLAKGSGSHTVGTGYCHEDLCQGGGHPRSPLGLQGLAQEVRAQGLLRIIWRKRVAACWNRKFQKTKCSPCLPSVPHITLPLLLTCLEKPAGSQLPPSGLCFCLSISWPSFLSGAEEFGQRAYPRVAMTTNQAFGLHGDKPSKFLFIGNFKGFPTLLWPGWAFGNQR